MSQSVYVKKLPKELIPGDIVLHPIYRSDGLLFVNKNIELNPLIINKIRSQVPQTCKILVATSKKDFEDLTRNKSFESLDFTESIKEIVEEYNINALTKTDINSYLTTRLEQSITKNIVLAELLSKIPFWINLESGLESEYLRLRAKKIKQEFIELLAADNTFHIWFETFNKSDDDSFVINSLNVTCVALLTGLILELNDSDLLDLAVAALFSNVGYTKSTGKTHSNVDRGSFYARLVKNHLDNFLAMTSESPYLRKKNIIFGIHDSNEYYNGKGYPNGKKGEAISLFGRILLIVHAHKELINAYSPNQALQSYQVLRLLYENNEGKYDKNIIKICLYRTVYYKLGQLIILPNHQKGKIIGFRDYASYPHLPIVQLNNGTIVDLSLEP